MCPGSDAAQLEQVGPLAVTETVSPFSINAHGTGALAQGSDGLGEPFGRGDDWWYALGGGGEEVDVSIGARLAGRCFVQRLRRFRLGGC